jgi:hypothetical protein
LRAGCPVVVGKAEAAGEQFICRVEGEDRNLIISITFQEVDAVIVEVQALRLAALVIDTVDKLGACAFCLVIRLPGLRL